MLTVLPEPAATIVAVAAFTGQDHSRANQRTVAELSLRVDAIDDWPFSSPLRCRSW
jgi:hypothetical protein